MREKNLNYAQENYAQEIFDYVWTQQEQKVLAILEVRKAMLTFKHKCVSFNISYDDKQMLIPFYNLEQHYEGERGKQNTLLGVAVEKNLERVVKELITQYASLNAKGCSDFTPLHIALSQPTYNINIIEALINARANLNLAVLPQGATPLHQVATKKNKRILEKLIQHGAFVDAQTFLCAPFPAHQNASSINSSSVPVPVVAPSSDTHLTALHTAVGNRWLGGSADFN